MLGSASRVVARCVPESRGDPGTRKARNYADLFEFLRNVISLASVLLVDLISQEKRLLSGLGCYSHYIGSDWVVIMVCSTGTKVTKGFGCPRANESTFSCRCNMHIAQPNTTLQLLHDPVFPDQMSPGTRPGTVSVCVVYT